MPQPSNQPARKSTGNRTRKKRVRRFEPIRRPKPLWKVFLEDLPHSGPGVLISIAFHAVLLFIFTLILVKNDDFGDVLTIDLAWFDPGSYSQPNIGLTALPVSPVEISSFKNMTKDKEPDDTKGATANDEDKPKSPVAKPVEVEEMLAGRRAELRGKLITDNGGDKNTERAIRNGLLWLSRRQLSDGRWQLHEGYPDAATRTLRTDAGATSLALLCFLGAGQTETDGEFQETVSRGIDWLVAQQKPDGNLHDRTEQGLNSTYYAHAIGTIVLCESIVLSGSDERRGAAEKAVKFLLASQHPIRGGWRYRPQNDLSESDLSVTGWALMALHTARMAKIDVPEEALLRSTIFLDSVQDGSSWRYKYLPSDSDGSYRPSMAAEGLLCRQWLSWPRDSPEMYQGVSYLTSERNRPNWEEGRRNLYAWYYTAHVLHNFGGPDWKSWYRDAQAILVDRQVRTGKAKGDEDTRGSWHPNRPVGSPYEYGDKAGRLYISCLSILILETPFRHQPIYDEEQN